MHRSVLFALLAAAMPATALADASPADTLAEAFCAAMIASTEPMDLLTPSLGEVIETATARNAAWQAANPGEKPPLGDGIPWHSWQDYADGCTIISVRHGATQSGVTIRYSFSTDPAASYEDVLVIAPDAGPSAILGIDDIVYGVGGTLREVLDSAFDPFPAPQ